LRKLCTDRMLGVSIKAHTKTCCKALLDWKAKRTKIRWEFTPDLVTEGDSLERLLADLSTDDIRQLCRERDLGSPGDLLYHRAGCVNLLLLHQLRGLHLAHIMSSPPSKREAMRAEKRNPLRSPVMLRSTASPVQAPSQREHESINLSQENLFRFYKGDAIQLRYANHWYQCTVLHVKRDGSYRVRWDHNGEVEDIDTSAATRSNCRLVYNMKSSGDESSSQKLEGKENQSLIHPSNGVTIETLLRRRLAVRKRRRASVHIATVIGRIARVRFVMRCKSAAVIKRSVRRYLMWKRLAMERRERLVRDSFSIHVRPTASSLIGQLSLISELIRSATLQLSFFATFRQFNVNDSSTLEIIRAISDVAFAAGSLAHLPFFAHCKEASKLDVQREEATHPTGLAPLSIDQHRAGYLEIPGVMLIDQFVCGVSGIKHLDTSHSPGRYFAVNLISSIAYPHRVPFALAWLGKQIYRCATWETQQHIRENTGVIPNPWFAKEEITSAVIAQLPISSALGTVTLPPGTLSLQVDSDNFERKFSGDIANTSSILERHVVVSEERYPLLHSHLQLQTLKEDVAMRNTGLEFDVAAWCGSEKSDSFAMFIFYNLAVAADRLTKRGPVRSLQLCQSHLGDHRRSQQHADHGLYPVDFALTDLGVTARKMQESRSHPDGLNVFTRNNTRILRQWLEPYAKGETLDKLQKEAKIAAAEAGVHLSMGGDGAPMKYFVNQIKRAIRAEGQANSHAPEDTVKPNARVPTSRRDMEAYLTLSGEDRIRLSTLEQHQAFIDESTGQVIQKANPEWINARAFRITASAASTFAPAAVRGLRDAGAATRYIQAHELLIVENKWDTIENCRPPVRNKIKNTFTGNKFTDFGNQYEDTALAVSIIVALYIHGV
jgi:hypothetical protein